MKFREWMDNQTLNGEYWITNDGTVMYADGDIGDYNHEGYVFEYMQNEIMDEFNVDDDSGDWERVKQKIVQEILDSEDEQTRAQLEEFVEDEGKEALILAKLKEIDPQNAEEKMKIAEGLGDAREFAIKNWGWKRVAGNDIESSSLTPKDMQAIAQGIGDIHPDISDDATFSISTYGNQHYDVTMKELESGRLGSLENQINPVNQPQAIRQRQQDKWNQTMSQSANKYIGDKERETLHPFYQNKPMGDWTIN